MNEVKIIWFSSKQHFNKTMTKSHLDLIEASNKVATTDETKAVLYDDAGLKATLAASNDPCWLATNSPRTRKKIKIGVCAH